VRAVLIWIACAACAPAAPPRDAVSTDFAFTGDYRLDATITAARFGSASYTGGQTLHIEQVYPSYEAAQSSGLAVAVASGSATGELAITPSCPAACAGATREQLTATVTWSGSAGPIVTASEGSCESPSGGCGWAP
jgi:hypothetical protein